MFLVAHLRQVDGCVYTTNKDCEGCQQCCRCCPAVWIVCPLDLFCWWLGFFQWAPAAFVKASFGPTSRQSDVRWSRLLFVSESFRICLVDAYHSLPLNFRAYYRQHSSAVYFFAHSSCATVGLLRLSLLKATPCEAKVLTASGVVIAKAESS